jgi:hypothetical protein
MPSLAGGGGGDGDKRAGRDSGDGGFKGVLRMRGLPFDATKGQVRTQ